ncbi:MAG: hypothetical protein QM758_13390 [Armatimonas sp.]
MLAVLAVSLLSVVDSPAFLKLENSKPARLFVLQSTTLESADSPARSKIPIDKLTFQYPRLDWIPQSVFTKALYSVGPFLFSKRRLDYAFAKAKKSFQYGQLSLTNIEISVKASKYKTITGYLAERATENRLSGLSVLSTGRLYQEKSYTNKTVIGYRDYYGPIGYTQFSVVYGWNTIPDVQYDKINYFEPYSTIDIVSGLSALSPELKAGQKLSIEVQNPLSPFGEKILGQAIVKSVSPSQIAFNLEPRDAEKSSLRGEWVWDRTTGLTKRLDAKLFGSTVVEIYTEPYDSRLNQQKPEPLIQSFGATIHLIVREFGSELPPNSELSVEPGEEFLPLFEKKLATQIESYLLESRKSFEEKYPRNSPLRTEATKPFATYAKEEAIFVSRDRTSTIEFSPEGTVSGRLFGIYRTDLKLNPQTGDLEISPVSWADSKGKVYPMPSYFSILSPTNDVVVDSLGREYRRLDDSELVLKRLENWVPDLIRTNPQSRSNSLAAVWISSKFKIVQKKTFEELNAPIAEFENGKGKFRGQNAEIVVSNGCVVLRKSDVALPSHPLKDFKKDILAIFIPTKPLAKPNAVSDGTTLIAAGYLTEDGSWVNETLTAFVSPE